MVLNHVPNTFRQTVVYEAAPQLSRHKFCQGQKFCLVKVD